MGVAGRTAVMVVDDDAAIREMLVLLLELNGVCTSEAVNGLDALRLLRRGLERPDAIVLDLDMPVMNGWQFRREQLCDPEIAGIPVVVASGSDPGPIRADAHLCKPYRVSELLRALREVGAARRAA